MSLHVPDGTRHHAPDGARHRQGPDGITFQIGRGITLQMERGIVRRLTASSGGWGLRCRWGDKSSVRLKAHLGFLKPNLRDLPPLKGGTPDTHGPMCTFGEDTPASIRFPGQARLTRPRGILRVQRLWLVINVTTIPTRIGISQIAADLGAPVLRCHYKHPFQGAVRRPFLVTLVKRT